MQYKIGQIILVLRHVLSLFVLIQSTLSHILNIPPIWLAYIAVCRAVFLNITDLAAGEILSIQFRGPVVTIYNSIVIFPLLIFLFFFIFYVFYLFINKAVIHAQKSYGKIKHTVLHIGN
jgi:hypothetical protein